jgi:hypothetical protein
MAQITLSRDMYRHASEQGITFSQLLEQKDPTPEGSKLTAFERQLKEHKIVTQSIPSKGIIASTIEAFYRTEESKVLFPEYVATQLREALVASSILPYLIATTTPIDNNAYRTIYCDDSTENKKAAQKRRVTEAAELPKARLKTRENSVKIWKYGRQIEASYEVIRRMRVDLLAVHLRRLGEQAAMDEVEDVLDVIKNGDGNPNTAATVLKNKTDLDAGATAGTLSKEAWLRFLLKFFPYQCNTVVANEDGLLQVLDIIYPSDTTQMMDFLLKGMAITAKVELPQKIWTNVTLLYSPAVEKINNHVALYGIDSRYAIEKIQETGSDITEADKFITNQTQVLTVSENAGFATMFPQAMRILEID